MSNHAEEHPPARYDDEWLDALPDEHPNSPIGYTIAAQPQDNLERRERSPMWAKILAPVVALAIIGFLFCCQLNYPT